MKRFLPKTSTAGVCWLQTAACGWDCPTFSSLLPSESQGLKRESQNTASWKGLLEISIWTFCPKQGYFQNKIKLLWAFVYQVLKISRGCTTPLGNLSKSSTHSWWKNVSFYLVGISLGAISDCCLPPSHHAPRRAGEGGYTENMNPFR